MYIKPKGTRDYFLQEAVEFAELRKLLYKVATIYNYNEIIFPTFENEDLFNKSIGAGTDVVTKEMFKFLDNSQRSMVLRPEGTASTVRLCVENRLLVQNQKQKFFYFMPMFRYERPQKGRQREFYQFGIENFGRENIATDIEVVLFAKRILDELKISKYTLKINSIGSEQTRKNYLKKLKTFLDQNEKKLSDDSRQKLKNNILRILDSKDDSDIKLLKKAPKIYDSLSSKEKERIDGFMSSMDNLGIKYEHSNSLVRGLDYYSDLVFEFVSTDEEKLGSKATLIGGGRYDGLVGKMTNNQLNVPAIGFALGVERLMLASSEFLKDKKNLKIDYYLITDSTKYVGDALKYAEDLRKTNVVETDFEDIKINKKLERLKKFDIENIIIFDDDFKKGYIKVRNVIKKNTEKVKI